MADDRNTVAEIDRRLLLARASLVLARARLARRPGAEGQRACQAAEEQLDDLLDQRLALSRGCPPTGAR